MADNEVAFPKCVDCGKYFDKEEECVCDGKAIQECDGREIKCANPRCNSVFIACEIDCKNSKWNDCFDGRDDNANNLRDCSDCKEEFCKHCCTSIGNMDMRVCYDCLLIGREVLCTVCGKRVNRYKICLQPECNNEICIACSDDGKQTLCKICNKT